LCCLVLLCVVVFFFFQAEDGIRDFHVTGVQTCALPILLAMARPPAADLDEVIARLADLAQQDALQVMRQSLWAGEGDPARARLGLRAAFRHGPRWHGEAPLADSMPLPPLYPPRQDR